MLCRTRCGRRDFCNTITRNTVFGTCANCCSTSHASKLLEDVGVTWVEPDIIMYPTIIMGDCVEGDVDRNFHILEEMKKDGRRRPDDEDGVAVGPPRHPPSDDPAGAPGSPGSVAGLARPGAGVRGAGCAVCRGCGPRLLSPALWRCRCASSVALGEGARCAVALLSPCVAA